MVFDLWRDSGGIIHREIFAFPRPKEGQYKGREWELLVKSIIKKWKNCIRLLFMISHLPFYRFRTDGGLTTECSTFPQLLHVSYESIFVSILVAIKKEMHMRLVAYPL